MQVVGISNEPIEVIENFIEDQGITFPVLKDNAGVYGSYNIPGGQSPYPRDYIIDDEGVLRFAKTEYDPGTMINIIESLLEIDASTENDLNLLVPETIQLHPNYPNPFNPVTTLQFTLTKSDMISLDIVNLAGSVVATIYENTYFESGSYSLEWNGKTNHGHQLPTGHYIVRLQNNHGMTTRKLLMLK